jgi:uncharacterized membrane protein YGL010W
MSNLGPMQKAYVFAEYGAYHTDRRNRLCHAIGIPLIVLALLGLLALVRIGPLNLGIVFAVATLIFYASFDLLGAAISAVIFGLLYAAAIHLSWPVNVTAFIVGWVFQLVGHKFEGKKPKFLENLTYLLIGPLYMFEELVMGVLGSKRPA